MQPGPAPSGGNASGPAPGYWLEFAPGEAEPERGHVFCGTHAQPSARCPNCDAPLLQYAALDVRDARLSLRLALDGRLPLLFCWTCALAQDELHYRVEPSGALALLACGRGGVETDFPYSQYPRAFPAGRLTLAPIAPAEQSVIAAANRGEIPGWRLGHEHPELAAPRHQLGGEPLHAGGLRPRRCAGCGEPMPFLAAFGDACLDPRGFTGNPFVQVLFHVCARCTAVCAVQTCD